MCVRIVVTRVELLGFVFALRLCITTYSCHTVPHFAVRYVLPLLYRSTSTTYLLAFVLLLERGIGQSPIGRQQDVVFRIVPRQAIRPGIDHGRLVVVLGGGLCRC